MKKVICYILILICLLSICSCKDNKDDTNSESNMIRYSKSDAATQKMPKKSIYTVESISIAGNENYITLKPWSYIVDENGEFTFTEKDEENIEARIDNNTQVLMGKIFEYDGETPLKDYDKTTTMKYFVKHSAMELKGYKLFFVPTIEDGYLSKIQLFWDYYFNK